MVRIGVISDTHVPARARSVPSVVMDAFADVAMILHAGDVAAKAVLEALERLAPVYAVRGNVDPPSLARELPRKRTLEVEGATIGLIHGDGPDRSKTAQRAFRSFASVDCVVFGHSHQPMCERWGTTLMFNPGSPTDKRREAQYSFGLLTVSDGKIEGEIVRFGGKAK